jgi:hypothetical protein
MARKDERIVDTPFGPAEGATHGQGAWSVDSKMPVAEHVHYCYGSVNTARGQTYYYACDKAGGDQCSGVVDADRRAVQGIALQQTICSLSSVLLIGAAAGEMQTMLTIDRI